MMITYFEFPQLICVVYLQSRRQVGWRVILDFDDVIALVDSVEQ